MIFILTFGFLLLQCNIAVNGLAATEQSGKESIETQTAPTVDLYVSFKTKPSAFTVAPTVYSWIRKSTGVVPTPGSGEFRTKVNSVDAAGFYVTVSRYDDPTSGWDFGIDLYWNAIVETEATSVSIQPTTETSETIHVTFNTPCSVAPDVDAYVRGNPDYPDKFQVTLSNIDVSGFDATIVRSDSKDVGWSQTPTLYWKMKEVPESSKENSNSIGQMSSTRSTIPDSVWVYTPALTAADTDTFDILGRDVYLSTVRQLLVENTQGSFPVLQTDKSRMSMKLTVRGDTVYLDKDVTFEGLKSFSINARQLIGANGTLTFQAPAVCETLDGDTCTYLTKAALLTDGMNGNSGIDSTSVDIYVHDIIGNVNVVTKASDGNPGEGGGDGYAGTDNTWETSPLSDGETCDRDCGALFDEKNYRGNPGPNGGNGGDAAEAGKSGVGGSAGAVTFNAEKTSGYISIVQKTGAGGGSVEHGFGGRGGYGGTGGCGRRCRNWLMCIITICWPECTSDQDCGNDRGYAGVAGSPGYDGFQQYPVSFEGEIGGIGKSTVKRVASVKSQFVDQTDLLNVMLRYAENLFQRNDNDEAADVFSFLQSVSDTSSAVYQEASSRLTMISEGFDYYGHTENYAPDLDWSYLQSRTDSLIETGNTLEQAYNTVQGELEDIIELSQAMQTAATVAITTEDRELANSEVELNSERELYVKALRQLQREMRGEVLKINILVPLCIVQDELQHIIGGVVNLIGGIAGFVDGLITLDVEEAFDSAMQVVDVFFGRGCDDPTIKESVVTLHQRLDFGYSIARVDPEDLDFTTLNASAVPAIMLSDLLNNKAALTKELECLYDNPSSKVVQDLDRVVNDFYRNGGLRIIMIDRIMNFDVQLKEIAYKRNLLATTQSEIDLLVTSTESSVAMDVKTSFTDLLFNLYQTEEDTIMRSLYELSKAYQFTCLWDFHTLDKYTDFFDTQVMTTDLGSLEGIFELEMLRQSLEDERNVFLNLIASSAGPSSHTYNKYWEFDNITTPEVIETLQTDGQILVKMDLDPNDVTSAGCDSCYNARLEALYIEIHGEAQNNSVPSTVYIQVAHMGDSSFLFPLNGNNKGVQLLAQSPENVDGGHVMSFDYYNSVTSVDDPLLDAKFLKAEYDFCDDSDDFFGSQPCKSPYASYTITVPRTEDLDCSLDPNFQISGTNCKDLDFTKFSSVRVYAKVESWSDYPIQPDETTMKSFINKMKGFEDEV